MQDDIRPGTFISDALHSIYVRPPQFMDVLKECIAEMGFETECRPWYRTDTNIPEICAGKNIPEFNMLVHMETSEDEEILYTTVMLKGPGTSDNPPIEYRYTINLRELLYVWSEGGGRMKEQFMRILKQILSQIHAMMCNMVFIKNYKQEDLVDEYGHVKHCKIR